MSAVLVREATPKDTSVVTELGRRTFVEAFAVDNHPQHIDDYLAEAFASDRIAAELADPHALFLIASDGGRDVGYAKIVVGEAPENVTGDSPIELERIYVLQDVLGTGVGRALMTACLETARARGRDTVWLGVWERNDRAIRFYERFGFQTVGEKTFRLGGELQRDVVMIKRLNV